jgi:hypothetical protein
MARMAFLLERNWLFSFSSWKTTDSAPHIHHRVPPKADCSLGIIFHYTSEARDTGAILCPRQTDGRAGPDRLNNSLCIDLIGCLSWGSFLFSVVVYSKSLGLPWEVSSFPVALGQSYFLVILCQSDSICVCHLGFLRLPILLPVLLVSNYHVVKGIFLVL